jgi:hypothetical protein
MWPNCRILADKIVNRLLVIAITPVRRARGKRIDILPASEEGRTNEPGIKPPAERNARRMKGSSLFPRSLVQRVPELSFVLRFRVARSVPLTQTVD